MRNPQHLFTLTPSRTSESPQTDSPRRGPPRPATLSACPLPKKCPFRKGWRVARRPFSDRIHRSMVGRVNPLMPIACPAWASGRSFPVHPSAINRTTPRWPHSSLNIDPGLLQERQGFFHKIVGYLASLQDHDAFHLGFRRFENVDPLYRLHGRRQPQGPSVHDFFGGRVTKGQ